jgi:hypothetical protein
MYVTPKCPICPPPPDPLKNPYLSTFFAGARFVFFTNEAQATKAHSKNIIAHSFSIHSFHVYE